MAFTKKFHLFIFADFGSYFLFLFFLENILIISISFPMFQYEEVGIGLVGFGILFSFLGVILFFDRGLLALGNV